MSELDKVQVIIEEINATDLVPGICGHKSYYIASRDVALSPSKRFSLSKCESKNKKLKIKNNASV